ncbi:hypothetical protein NADFUDRAFT_24919 [Nadsonia fulvescens var. elongata DSM 6958]|uniref:PX domain-containing protein n=1 Tax=Nadsonia fulvescens var. elongata DSM 6958 TaxID=857566 RepID=A0A1E3PI46_9ASCO|nr:hypothetical protein NADFUDRAFT_24919 [Nadsonia fulvescens var. elongata DSM 6958]
MDNEGSAPIRIVEASKSREGTSRGFIAYTIKIGDLSVRRRYSEFGSLRATLTKMFPTIIIPPIPEKHAISNYIATSPSKVREDMATIEHRQRMLTIFLNRCKSIRQIRESSVFQRFLDSNVSWGEVLNSPPVSLLPKSILKAPPLDPSSPSEAHTHLPIPASSAKLRITKEDKTFVLAEQNAKEYESVVAGSLDKTNRRIIRRYSDIAHDCSELGAYFNAFSLEEDSVLAPSIEMVGQAIDNSYISANVLLGSLSTYFSEPLGETAQFASVVRSVLKYRRQKALQVEITGEQLAEKMASLAELERVERESQRLNSILQKDLSRSASLSPEILTPTSAQTPPRKKSGFKIPGMSAISSAVHGFIDADPETTRRNNIGKTREQISYLRAALDAAKEDLKAASNSIKTDLDRFQQSKEKDLRLMMISYLRNHVEWAKKNAEAWEGAKTEIDKI